MGKSKDQSTLEHTPRPKHTPKYRRRDVLEPLPCNMCGGLGVIIEQGEEYECPTCEGTGEVYEDSSH